jgi:photosystem II stability/assembly factor-like uncharacterized protein
VGLKKVVVLIFLSIHLLCTVNIFAQQWSSTSVPHGRSIYSIHLLGDNTIIATGGRLTNDSLQSAFKSTNKGLMWNVNYDIIAPLINATSFYNNQTGYGVGNNGKTIKTTDGGETWGASTSPLNRHFHAISYINEQTLIAVGGRNSGSDTLQTIVKSNDSGENWTTIIDQSGQWLKSVCFINSDTGFSVGTKGIILKTSDGGNNWNPILSPLERDFNSVYFTNETTGFIAGGIQNGDAKRTLLKTSDGGQTWNIVLDENAAWLNALNFYDNTNGYAVGDSATLLKTIDGGENWQTQTVFQAPDSAYFNCVKFQNEDFGLIGSSEGVIYTFSNLPLPQVNATGATVTNNTDATLNASINGNGNAFVYSFLFDTDSTLSNYSETFEVEATNSTLSPYTAFIPGLINDTIYYYCVKARNLSGTVYSDTLPFYTGILYSIFETTAPTLITSNTARLNATVAQLQHAVELEFQYGTSPLFGNSIAAEPFQITDTQSYQPYADITGLQPNTHYYYRLKATLPNSTEIFSNTRYFYNGDNTIPNFDFQLWNNVQAELLNDWSFVGDSFQKVQGHTGNYALRLSGNQLAFLGNIAFEESGNNPGFYGGIHFNYRPDSVAFFANYTIEDADTAWVLIKLYSNTNDPVSLKFYPVTGTSSGQFQRVSYEIDYLNNNIPDSLIIGIVTTNPFDTTEQQNISSNYIVIDDISFGNSAPNVLNSDFEDWRIEPYELLTEWNPHIYFENPGDSTLISKVISEQPNDYAAQIKNKKNSSEKIIGAQITTAGSIFNDDRPNFAVNARHNTLSGIYKFLPENGDTMMINIILYNQGTEIASGEFQQSETITDFTQFDIVLNYNSELSPDSGNIKISSYLDIPHGESILVIDKLRFDDPGIQVSTVEINKNKTQRASIFPNPGSEGFTVTIADFSESLFTVDLLSISGNSILTKSSNNCQSVFNTTDLAAGLYLIKIQYATDSEIIKWIKN